MILYALACDAGHCFEAWFRDSAAFDDQQARGLVTCLECGSPHVAKTIMAPAIVSRRTARPPTIQGRTIEGRTIEAGTIEGEAIEAKTIETNAAGAAGGAGAPLAPASPPQVKAPLEVALFDDRQREVRALARAFREKVMAESQDVGTSFSTEARRMHDGEIPERQIRGRATLGEARELIEDGILVLPLPNLPDEMN